MVEGVLSMAERPVRSIMTPATEVVWIDADGDSEILSRRILQTAHAAYPVCRGTFENLLGVARAPDLVGDLLETGHIQPETIDREPLTLTEAETVLHLVEQARSARIPMAIVKDQSANVIGVVTPSDLLRTILGRA
jgi:CBS domain containing-hemolysin-like protein